MHIDVQSFVTWICQEGRLRMPRSVSNLPTLRPFYIFCFFVHTVDQPDVERWGKVLHTVP